MGNWNSLGNGMSMRFASLLPLALVVVLVRSGRRSEGANATTFGPSNAPSVSPTNSPSKAPTPCSTQQYTAHTNVTAIQRMVSGYTNVAALTQGATCTGHGGQTDVGTHSCEGAFDGLYKDWFQVEAHNSAATRWTFWAHSSATIGTAWLKVTFAQVYDIKFMGLFARDCSCERWNRVSVESANCSAEVDLAWKSRYSVYELNAGPTNWIKFRPTSMHKKQHNPGAVELEFWTPSSGAGSDSSVATGSSVMTAVANTTMVNTAPLSGVQGQKDCPNPFLPSDSPCPQNWNAYHISKATGAQVGGKLQLLKNSNLAHSQNLTLLQEGSWVVRTAPWEGGSTSFLALKVSFVTVRGTKYGDCRSSAQRKQRKLKEWLKVGSIEKVCRIQKWSACVAGSCKSQKICKLDAYSDGDMFQNMRAELETCLAALCADKCALS